MKLSDVKRTHVTIAHLVRLPWSRRNNTTRRTFDYVHPTLELTIAEQQSCQSHP